MSRITDAEVTLHVESVSDCIVNSIYYKETSSGKRKMLNLTCECGASFDIEWVKFNRTDGRPQRQCRKCGLAKRGVTQRKTDAEYQLEKQNNGINIRHLEPYINRHTPIKHECPICHSDDWLVSPGNILGGHSTKCKKCTGGHNKLDDNWYQLTKNRLDIDIKNIHPYDGSETPIWHVCPVCDGGWLVRPGHILKKISKTCTPCSYNLRGESRKLTNEDVISILKGLSLKWVSGEYEGHDSVLVLRCTCGNLFKKRFSDARSGWNRCSKCAFSISTGEKAIKDYLDEKSTQYIHQQKFDDLRGKRNMPLSYDFGIYDNTNNLVALVEYDGAHHFQPIYSRYKTIDLALKAFEEVRSRDNRKDKYARKIGIPLIRLSGKQYENLDANLGSKLTEIFTIC